MPSDPIQKQSGSFIPTTGVRDQTNKGESLVQAMRENINFLSQVINTKDSGFYSLTEFVNGQVWFPDPLLNSSTPQTPELRQAFRQVVYATGPAILPTAPTLIMPHGITVTANTMWTRIYGTATNTVALIGVPIPYVAVAPLTIADGIEIYVDNTNVNINAPSAIWAGYTKVVVVLEYLQN